MPCDARKPESTAASAVHAPLVVAEHEPVMQIGRDDAELRAQVEHVPVVARRRRGPAARRRSGAAARSSCVSSADERRLAGAVRADDGGVLAGVDGERQAVEDATVVLDDRRIGQFENRSCRQVAIYVGSGLPLVSSANGRSDAGRRGRSERRSEARPERRGCRRPRSRRRRGTPSRRRRTGRPS